MLRRYRLKLEQHNMLLEMHILTFRDTTAPYLGNTHWDILSHTSWSKLKYETKELNTLSLFKKNIKNLDAEAQLMDSFQIHGAKLWTEIPAS